MTNVELVKQAYSDFAAGNIEGALAQFDPEIEWHECKGMPFIKGDGIKATGNEFKANATHVWTVKNGKLSRFFQATDTATINS